MNTAEVHAYLHRVKDARAEFARVQTKFRSDMDAVLSRLTFEGLALRMSVEQIARASGVPTKRIKDFMRSGGMSPSESKTALSRKAAEALANNAALLGVEPNEIDLMSPLAYLPMGSVLRRELQDRSVSQVTEEDVSGNFYERVADTIYDAMPWEGETYQAAAENIANAVLGELGICYCGAGMPCIDCGRGL